ncbi:hypothetical protein HYW44_00340 [Candidatus Daviesbacteria bacterium]|nr:hypothetical protein [Candidatus Daviesbacteria bacterium]
MGNKYLYLIFASIGFIFLRSGYGKISEGKFVGSLGETLAKFASKNPYPLVKNFLEQTAIPNSEVFGLLTMYGEVFAGISITLTSIYLLFVSKGSRAGYMILGAGFLTGAFLNAVFWLSAGYTSASTESLNLIMLAVQIIGLWFVWQKLMVGEK